MCAWIVEPEELSEPVPAPVIWVDRIGAISLIDDVVSIYYVAERQSLFGNVVERTVEVVLKRHISRIPEGIAQGARIMDFCFGRPQIAAPPVAPGPFRPRVVG